MKTIVLSPLSPLTAIAMVIEFLIVFILCREAIRIILRSYVRGFCQNEKELSDLENYLYASNQYSVTRAILNRLDFKKSVSYELNDEISRKRADDKRNTAQIIDDYRHRKRREMERNGVKDWKIWAFT